MDNQKLTPNSDLSKDSNPGPRIPGAKNTPVKRIAFMGGNDDFRAARMRCALACEEYNKLGEDAPIEDRVRGWLKITDPNYETNNSDKSPSPVDFSNLYKGGPKNYDSAADVDTPPVTPTAFRAPAPRPTIPYIKTPIHIDYGLRVHIAPTTFINRNCAILDTPVADIVIGERCSIGPGVTIISVGHPVRFEERCEFESGRAGSWGAKVVIGDGVWVGAGVTILPGVTIGPYSTIGAGSVVAKDIPPRCVATGNPATVRYIVDDVKVAATFTETVTTLEDALKAGREEGD
ncbi:hypothetical protein VM1G_07649 [Cytospora mali]|uniref:Uncharacterized protein n=1 Tax=Cytospora mali TaxID=578113 RepID=A0A194W7G6_CYTMA|nr:hypothetical protein VM1G_07649 [Valsa mali]